MDEREPTGRKFAAREEEPVSKIEAQATPGEVLTVACPTCSAAAGEPCDGSYHKFFWLGVFVRSFSGARIHTSRYLTKVRGVPWTPPEKATRQIHV